MPIKFYNFFLPCKEKKIIEKSSKSKFQVFIYYFKLISSSIINALFKVIFTSIRKFSIKINKKNFFFDLKTAQNFFTNFEYSTMMIFLVKEKKVPPFFL